MPSKLIRTVFLLFPAFILTAAVYAQNSRGIYISPNNDGVKDALEFSLEIKDERYVQAWTFIVENEKGEIVRTISNKESRPEMETSSGIKGVMSSIWKMITRVKRGVDVPEKIRWDGLMDNGATAPDGKYFFYVTAEDDNKNTQTTGKMSFYIDNTPPEISALPPEEKDGMIFSPDGDNRKDTFIITQTGSKEDLWEISITNTAGLVVRSEKITSSEPGNFVWDGKDNAGKIVNDGVYSYKISSTDRAGNKNSAEINNIIVNTLRPAVRISIDTQAFSPNGDGIKDTLTLTPSIPVTEGLQYWDVSIVNSAGEKVRTYRTTYGEEGPTGPVEKIAFEGKSENGRTLPEGKYQAFMTAGYRNGHEAEARSPAFTLDVTAPKASVSASTAIFSPVGDGELDTVTFSQKATEEVSWTAEIFPAKDGSGIPGTEPVRTIHFGPKPPEAYVWDGRTDNGRIAPDGRYIYTLSTTDMAGNKGSSNPAEVSLNTEKADVILQSNYTAFSPNGDGTRDEITFTPVLKAETPVETYRLEIKNSAGVTVKTMSGGSSVPASFKWDGKQDGEEKNLCPDGLYKAVFYVTLINKRTSSSASPDFTIDTVYPEISVSSPWLLFSPNEQSSRKTIPLTQISSGENQWTGKITDASNNVVRNLVWRGKTEDFEWDACDDFGNRVKDGVYSYTVSSTDEAGNKTEKTIKGITVDSRIPKAYITAALPAFSPNGDTVMDVQTFAIETNITDNISSWEINIVPEDSESEDIVKHWPSAGNNELPSKLEWDGKDDSGNVVQGKHRAVMSLVYEKGESTAAITPPFLINTTPPDLGVDLAPRFFSPDNDGIDDDLFINLSAKSLSPFEEWSFEIKEPEGTSGKTFWKAGGNGTITEQIIWDGRSSTGELVQAATDYPYTFTVRDNVGMTSVVRGYIPVDVLVIRDGNNLKMAVPSIIFAKNVATFDGLDENVIEKNNQILSRVAEILNKFKTYNVIIEGHANNVTGTEREDREELIPLSQARADAIKVILSENGVNKARLSTSGMGGTKPVVPREDRDNWWKNRRVEFVLIK